MASSSVQKLSEGLNLYKETNLLGSLAWEVPHLRAQLKTRVSSGVLASTCLEVKAFKKPE